MTLDDIADVKRGFRDAAARALDAGFKVIEVYAAHGFLLHQFYSPLANQRAQRATPMAAIGAPQAGNRYRRAHADCH